MSKYLEQFNHEIKILVGKLLANFANITNKTQNYEDYISIMLSTKNKIIFKDYEECNKYFNEIYTDITKIQNSYYRNEKTKLIRYIYLGKIKFFCLESKIALAFTGFVFSKIFSRFEFESSSSIFII